MQLPAIDQNICASWTELERDFYNKLPFYFVRATAQYQERYATWNRLLENTKWTPNQGDTMRLIGLERSPVLRQLAHPRLLSEMPLADVNLIRERTTDVKLRRHRFVSPHFHFLPAFQDFIGKKVEPYRVDINRQIEIFTEAFYRTHMWNWSPYVYLCGYGLIDAPSGEGNPSMTTGKTAAWLQAEALPRVTSTLTFAELFKLIHIAEDEVGATPYEGSFLPKNWSEPMSGKFALIGQSEVWSQFVDDPWVKENRPINLNIITDGLRGDIFGRIRFRAESYGLRIKADNNFVPSFPAPETVQLSGPEANRTIPNPDYTRNAQYGIAWLVGGPNYQIIKVGPPPDEFAGKDVKGIMGMDWNGRIELKDNFLIRCQDENGEEQLDTNSWGEYLRLQAQVVMGIVGFNKFNVIPIIYLRKNSITTVS